MSRNFLLVVIAVLVLEGIVFALAAAPIGAVAASVSAFAVLMLFLRGASA